MTKTKTKTKTKKSRRNIALTAVSGVVLGLTLPLTATASTAPTALRAKPLDWTKCEGTGFGPRQECATVDVPMDYADPGGEKIGIAVSRIRSEKPAVRRGVLLLIPGGPGGSSLEEQSAKARTLPREVREAYDLVVFDPRGNGRSAPVSCGFEQRDLAATAFRPWPVGPDGSVAGNLTAARRMAGACERNGGELLRHIDTVANARDVDRIRAALGERKLSAWGVSYGSYLGAVYAQLFPHRTDRFVLDSNLDANADAHDGQVARGLWAGFEQGVEDVFPEFAKWASAPGNPYRLADTAAEVRPVFLRLAARLDREPIPWPGANPAELNGNVLRQSLLDAFYDPEGFPAAARLILAARKGTVPPAPEPPPEALMQNGLAVASATFCNEGKWPASAARYQKEVDESRAKYPLTAGMPRNATLCAAWPYPPKQDPVRITDRGPSTVLMVQNERDPAAPLAGARELRAALGRRAVMVTVNATGHDAYLGNGNACGDAAVTRYLATGERPARDTYCR
ncbi:alpha/beta hydrolase [Streptomyces phaeochromogenes]|uniref:alpha/beta hydrolase n=1 Tax=Streptomyces phaeochromogenes TaxID=1923 RepID=UPI002E2E249E|nr:alpha/beta hydrolase [Streptomyces phaeochromogenes]